MLDESQLIAIGPMLDDATALATNGLTRRGGHLVEPSDLNPATAHFDTDQYLRPTTGG